jgi:hypothetical protein
MMNANLLKRWIVGKPMSLAQASHERLVRALRFAQSLVPSPL